MNVAFETVAAGDAHLKFDLLSSVAVVPDSCRLVDHYDLMVASMEEALSFVDLVVVVDYSVNVCSDDECRSAPHSVVGEPADWCAWVQVAVVEEGMMVYMPHCR